MKLGALAQAIGGRLIGDADLDVDVVRAIDAPSTGGITVATHARERALIATSKAAAVIVDDEFAADRAHEFDVALVCGPQPAILLAKAIALLHPAPPKMSRIHPSAVVEAGAVIGDDVVIGANAVVCSCVVIGARCVIGPGSVIGDDGFVFVPDGSKNVAVRHLGGVVIGDDVNIGANVCIDRGFLRDTVVGDGCTIDNLVQIAHDVVLGKDVVVTACVGVAGYAEVGDGAVFAGQSGVGPHVRIAKRVRVGGQAGVTHDVKDEGAAVSGTPAFAHREWLVATAKMKSLAALERRVKDLEAALEKKS